MGFNLSAGIYSREVNQSHVVSSVGNSVGAIVINADKGEKNKRVLITNNKQFIDKFGEPTNLSMHSALAFLRDANRLYVVRVISDATQALYTALDASSAASITFDALGEGEWGNDITLTLTATSEADVFELIVLYQLVEVERFTISKTKNKVNGFGRSLYVEDVINGISGYITATDVTSNTSQPLAFSNVNMSGGSNDTTIPTTNNVIAGYDLFASKDEVDISLLINAGWSDGSSIGSADSIRSRLIAIAESRKDCIAILDSEYQDSVTDTVNRAAVYNTTYAAMYSPWVYDYDQYHDSYNYLPPSGYVAGVFSRTANNSEIWAAPAGSRRGILDVNGVETTYSEGDRDTLYVGRINPIQQFFGEGVQIYGQRTLTSVASALDRVNVRMLMIDIRKSLELSLRPFVFEINDPYLRDNITSIVSNYLEDIQVRRGIYEYSVVCNSTNNTPQIIDDNKLVVDVYVKPTRVAEFIRVNAIVTATGVTLV